MKTSYISISEISQILGLPYKGDNEKISGLIKLVRSDAEGDSLITFCGLKTILPEILANRKIKALIIKPAIHRESNTIPTTMPVIYSDSPIEAFYQLHQYLYEKTDFYKEYDFPKIIGENCDIHPTAVLEDGVKIGANVSIGPLCCIRKGTTISDHCSIDANTVIGGEGFEIKKINEVYKTVPHCGGVRLESNVEIGASCVIDKSLFGGATVIGQNTKIDNLVQIGHNCMIGRDVLICSHVQISGSVTIGDRCYLAPSSTIRDQVSIISEAFIGMSAVVNKNITDPGTYIGIPAKLMKM